jgi:transposase
MASPPSRRQQFLPPQACLRLLSITFQDDSVIVRATAKSRTACCPDCQASSTVIHSRYWRVLQDLPFQGRAVKLHVEVRRFRCRDRACTRKTFVESLAAVTAKHSQQTARFSETIRIVGYALGGEAGCRLATRLGIPTSPDTVLRRINKGDSASSDAPKYIGVDDWAWRKGHRYGSILVDLETRRPVELLADRSADSFASWLKNHPTVQLISRDRAEAYADGARRGAPEATQVADRFHILCNLTSAVERVLETKRAELSKTCAPEEVEAQPPVAVEVPPKMTIAQERSKQSRDGRLDRYSKIMELHKQGLSDRAIGRSLDIARKTVGRFLRAGQFPERAKPRRQEPRVNKFCDYLQTRWAEGCHNATKLWREIQLQGYVGGRSMVATLVSTFRTPESKYHRQHSRELASKPKRRPVSPRQAAMLIARNPEKLNDEEKQLIVRLEKECPAVEFLRPLVRSFSEALLGKETDALQPWIDRATASGFPAIKNFCDGLIRDRAAVTAAISLKWSNGQVEGQVHRLKLIKRQMYGRASFKLLRARVLPYVPASGQVAQRSP